MRRGPNLANVFITILLALLSLVALFPFYQTLMMSFSTLNDVGANRIFLYPANFDLAAYKFLFAEGKVTRGLLVSGIVTVAGTAVSLMVTSAGAYALSKKSLPGRGLMFGGILFTLFFNGGLIPYFLTLQKLHLQNSLLVMILPLAVNTFYLILMKNFFQTISPALEESAKIDGANDITILARIVIPVSMPIMATMFLFYAVDRWNEWWLPTIFINDTKLYPLQLVLRNALTNLSASVGNASAEALVRGTQNAYEGSVRGALIMIAVAPILAVYPFVQKYFAQGIMIGSIKG
ncbi:carbohydrate ABC transporter permease [Cohnella fermenti]|uniref:Carbohydrate ABC transporter permease n=1 Tax=Cohnella fermenti TaxID=2565925 RepID=A0A4S4C5X4_9BACL|nr:carbohydrate ABC transporter permease [Cohnella fermenti]THF83240.1 carbohydrate ABC transporter permease [Cohnella fermenti]